MIAVVLSGRGSRVEAVEAVEFMHQDTERERMGWEQSSRARWRLARAGVGGCAQSGDPLYSLPLRERFAV